MSGAGNDFILFDKRFNPSLTLNSKNIVNLCDRRNGIGADGILVIDDIPDHDFSLEYYNSDGSTGTLCGNGSRCALRYASLSGRLKSGMASFLSNNIVYTGQIIDVDTVKFNLSAPKDIKLNFLISLNEHTVKASFANTGSPHVVIQTEDILSSPNDPQSGFKSINDVPVISLGRAIRNLPDFAPGGTNVNFIQINGSELLIRTYERGVEDETLACGTGSVAGALIVFLNYNIKPPVSLITRSGAKLIVDFQTEDAQLKNVSLSGPAEVTFTGEFYSNLYF